jgi:hypothetical protein
MSPRPPSGLLCRTPSCQEPALAKGLCSRHYEQQRHRHRDDQLLRTRARNRATKRVLDFCSELYAEFFEQELAIAKREQQDLELRGVPANARLKPGPKPKAESATLEERIREVGTCISCINFHARGHICPSCGARPVKSRLQKIKELLDVGKDPEWIVNNGSYSRDEVRRAQVELNAEQDRMRS